MKEWSFNLQWSIFFFYNSFIYTLCFDKPVSLDRICTKDFEQFNPSRIPFTSNVWGNFLYKGIKIFEEKFLSTSLNNYVFLIGQQDPYLFTKDVILIQKDAFLQTVASNISLFQKKLGSHINGKILLDAIETRRETFMNLINYDDELLGILLGYGKSNAHLFAHNDKYPEQDLAISAKEELALIFIPWFIADEKHQETIILRKKYNRQREEVTNICAKSNIVDIIFDYLK